MTTAGEIRYNKGKMNREREGCGRTLLSLCCVRTCILVLGYNISIELHCKVFVHVCMFESVHCIKD